jgi:hypothetical protein
MAASPSPEEGPPRQPPGRPRNIIGLLYEAIRVGDPTENLIRIIWAVALAFGPIMLGMLYVVVVAAKGHHWLSSPFAWTPAGLISGTYLTRVVIRVVAKRRGGGDEIEGEDVDAIDGK